MDQHCLNREELSTFLEIILGTNNFQTEDEQMRFLVEEWESWNLELLCLATILSQFLNNKQKYSDINVHNILEIIYNLPNEKGLFSIEQIDENFITYMLKEVRNDDDNIEDNLIEIRRKMSEYKY